MTFFCALVIVFSKVQSSILRVCNELSSSQACVRAFGTLECVEGIMVAMKGCQKSTLAVACEV
jgi:hypothetical protein